MITLVRGLLLLTWLGQLGPTLLKIPLVVAVPL